MSRKTSHILPSHVPPSPRPPTSTSVLTYQRGHSILPQAQSQSRRPKQPNAVTYHNIPESEPVEVKLNADPHGLQELTELVKLQDPTLETERWIHFHKPGERGPQGRWYIVRYGRHVGVFNDWYIWFFVEWDATNDRQQERCTRRH